jgi:hypothetical protein
MKDASCDSRKRAVRDFLQEVKQTVTKRGGKDQGWVLVKRKDNMDCLAELELDFRDVHDVILGLLVADYCEGPILDRDMPGELWVFGKVIAGKEVYIKLKLATFGGLRRVRVVSFHLAKESLC